MEELLQYCMRELAFDGDLGCDVSRLRHFIQSFYTSRLPPETQTVDDAFHTFVWALLVRQPSVRVGLVPKGAANEVYTAPQPSKRKTAAKPKKKTLVPETAPFPALDEHSAAIDDQNTDAFPGRLHLIPGAPTYPLENLVHQHGNSLRVAVDPETSFRAITGSHARPAKLTPMVYTALQLISRGRESGLGVIELGKKTGPRVRPLSHLWPNVLQFLFVNSVKLNQGSAGGGNFCIHKYFYTRSAFWEGVRREEYADNEDNGKAARETSKGSPIEDQFDPIDSRHLASTQLIKSRVVKLLKNSENGLHLYNNLLVAIGFSKPTKKDRRFFILRVRELIREKIIEKVIVPSVQGSSKAICIRLVGDPRTSGTEDIVVQPGDIGDEEQEEDALEDTDSAMTEMPIMNMTIHGQILKLLEQAGPGGLTLNNISSRLGMFDKRTIELLLYRLERYPPPPHLADLTTCDFIENHGRERRHRYYNLTGYISFVRNEGIDDRGHTTRYTSTDMREAGGFYLQHNNVFYTDHAALIKFEDEYRDRVKPPKGGGMRKIGRPRKEDARSKQRTSETKTKVAGAIRKPRAKATNTPTSITGDGDGTHVPPITKTQPLKGGKRKRKDEPDHVSELQPPSKKKHVQQVASTSSRAKSSFDPMDVDGAIAAQLLEHQTNKFSETSMVSLSKCTDSWESNSNNKPTEEVIYLENIAQFSEPVTSGSSTTILDHSMAGETATRSFRPSTPPATPNAGATPSTGGMMPNVALESRLAPMHSLLAGSEICNRGALPTDVATTGSKRSGDASATESFDQNLPKRPKTGRPKRTHELVNISQLRAENEIMRVVDESGGIANVSSKEFLETYARVVSSMVEAGDPTSMPVGNQPDRRTIRKILERLVDRGRLKTLTVTIIPRVTQPRLAKLIYNPVVPQGKIDQYLSSLREDVAVSSAPIHKELDQPLEFTRSRGRHVNVIRIAASENEAKNRGRDLNASGDDQNVMRTIFLSEAQTVAQFYGYLVGKARRARELHQFTLACLQEPVFSSHIVSQTERIVAFSYYFNDLPLSTYLAIVSAPEYSPQLSKLMETPEGRGIPVKDLPRDLNDQLKVGRSRARDRILGLLELLVSLKLVTPLQPSDSNTPYISCEPNNIHPIRFDVAQIAWDKGTEAVAVSYWHFNTVAPIFIYSQTNSWPPPFHRDVLVRTADESMLFWAELEDACLHSTSSILMTSMDSITGPCACTSRVLRTLRRRQSWTSSYVLSLAQRQYLRQKWTDPSTGYTPLSDQDGGLDCVGSICDIILAPFDTVYHFFATVHNMFIKEAERIHERNRRRREEHRERQTTEDKALLAKKAAEARRRLEEDWDMLVSHVHSAPLPYGSVTRLKELRTRYLHSRSGLTTQQWETAVAEAIAGLKSGKRNPVLPKLTSSFRKPSSTGRIPKPPEVILDQQKSVKELIDRYKEKAATIHAAPQKTKKKGKENNDNVDTSSSAVTEPLRRQRFQWTPEYDELARDASAVIRARCRTWYRMDWTALNQLFPFLPRNNVRQRVATLRQEAGGENYLRLLEDKWHELWLEYRGTEALPDDNPHHPANFDAVAHVEFLRKYIDKRALRVGLSRVDIQHATGAVLTESVSDFISKWNLEEPAQPLNKLDFMWSAIGDEHREKTLLREAFSTVQTTPPTPISTHSPSKGVAESALKMTLATYEGDYDASDAALLLGSIAQHDVLRASEELLARGVVSEVGNSHRKRPGRKLKISDLNEEALGGSFRADFFLEACVTEDAIEEEMDKWREWTPIATDGDMGTLIELVSDGKVDFLIDFSEAASYREELDWNSKKVDDDQIETTISIRYRPTAEDPTGLSKSSSRSPALEPVSAAPDRAISTIGHGLNDGVPSPCHLSSNGVITCSACVDLEQTTLLACLEPEERGICLDIIGRLDEAGRHGLSYQSFSTDPLRSPNVQAAVCYLTSTKSPLCYWVGYDYPVLVSRRHVRDWLIPAPVPSAHLVFPRRWLHINGNRMDDIWGAGLRAVVGVLVLRPGISQADLRQRLISVYDRQELNDLLIHLSKEGMIVKRHVPEDDALGFADIRAVGGVQERGVYWSLRGANPWYRVDE